MDATFVLIRSHVNPVVRGCTYLLTVNPAGYVTNPVETVSATRIMNAQIATREASWLEVNAHILVPQVVKHVLGF